MSDQALKKSSLCSAASAQRLTTPWWPAPCQAWLRRVSPLKRCLPSGDIPPYDADMQQGEGFPAAVEAIAEQIRQADGVIIVTPEHNYSVPGGSKLMTGYLLRRINRCQSYNIQPVRESLTCAVSPCRSENLDDGTNKPGVFGGRRENKVDEQAAN